MLLDGFDLGVGILFGLTRNEERRRAMLSAVAPMWDGNETWLVVAGQPTTGSMQPLAAPQSDPASLESAVSAIV